MVGDDAVKTTSDVGRSLQNLSIEKACQEYNNSVKATLDQINQQLDEALLRNCNGLDELAVKIAARTNFLEKNPSFLSYLVYEKKCVRQDALPEFDGIRVTLKEHCKRISKKLDEINRYHKRLLQLVVEHGYDETETPRIKTATPKVAATKTKPPTQTKDPANVDKIAEREKEASAEETTTTPEKTENEPRKIKSSTDTKTSAEGKETVTRGSKSSIEVVQEEDFQDCLDKLQQKEDCEDVVKSTPDTFKSCSNTTINQTPKAAAEEATKDVNVSKKLITISPKNSYNRVTINKSAFSSDLSLGPPVISPVQFQIFPDILPDVSRRKPIEDLHGKLIQQLVASDSLEGFLKLMDRKPTETKIKKKKDHKKQKAPDLEEKYTGSLYFFPKDDKKKPQNKSASVNTKISPIPQKPPKSPFCSSSGSTCCNLIVTSSQPCPMGNNERARKIRNNLHRNKLAYFDLLDDLDSSDLRPFKSDYPRRDNVYPTELQEAKSYLQYMMLENEKVWKKLLQPIDEHKEKRKKHSESKKKQHKDEQRGGVKTLLEYLTSPEQKFLSHIPQSLIVMPVRVVYDNLPTRDRTETPAGAVLITDLTKSAEPKRLEGRFLRSSPEIPRSFGGFPMQRKKAMLEQLQGLKLRNDNIQKNIQKAIDVIETKMIDLLSSPTDDTSHEAFNAMEKEITSVLSMMKEDESAKKEKEETQLKEEKKTPRKEEKPQQKKQEDEGEKKEQGEKEKKENDMKEQSEEKEERLQQIIEPVEEGRKMRKIHFVEPEKDVSVCSGSISNPTLKRQATIVVKKPGILDLKVDDLDLVAKMEKFNNPKKCNKEEIAKEPKCVKEEKKLPKEIHAKIKHPIRDDKRSKKRDRSSEKFKSRSRHDEELKKAANIEEGERLLGQVDSVIKKIDSIYNRFYDESTKTKCLTKQDGNFTNFSEFFDALKISKENPPVEIEYKYEEIVPEIFYTPAFYHQASTWYTPRLDHIPPSTTPTEELTPRIEYVGDAQSATFPPDSKHVETAAPGVPNERIVCCEYIQVPDVVLPQEEPKMCQYYPVSPPVEMRKEEPKLAQYFPVPPPVEVRKEEPKLCQYFPVPPPVEGVRKEEPNLCQYFSVPSPVEGVRKEEANLCQYFPVPYPVEVARKGDSTPRYEYVRAEPHVVPKEEFIAELRENKHKRKSKEVANRRVEKMQEKLNVEEEEDDRHAYTLKAFYTLFFSSIFVALNFDYAS